MLRQDITLRVNEKECHVEVDPWMTLAECLREKLTLYGVKVSCDQGDCGACTVLVNGSTPINACITLAVEADGKEITTIEGLANGGELTPIQKAFVANHGLQCGFCTPGMILSAKAVLDSNRHPTEQELKEALVGNLCRCGTYPRIMKSILAAAEMMGGTS